MKSSHLLSPGSCGERSQRRDFEREREVDDFHNWHKNLPSSPDWHQADVEGEVPDKAEHPGKHL